VDPYHVIIGAMQCTQGFWQWSDVPSFLPPAAPKVGAVIPAGDQPRLQLSLDVMMWENYREFSYTSMSDATTPDEVRRGVWFEPLINCYGLWNWGPGVMHSMTRVTPESPTVTRSMLWLSVLRADTSMQLTFLLDGNAWAPPEQRGDGGWLQTVAVSQWQAESKMLAPSLMSAFGSVDVRQPQLVVVDMATLLRQQRNISARTNSVPVVARGWREECGPSTNSSGVCAHIVAVNLAHNSPATFTLRVRLPEEHSFPTTASRLGINGGYDVPVECRPGTDCNEGGLTDWLGAAETVVYEIGCNGPPAWGLNQSAPYGMASKSKTLLPRPSTQVVEPPLWSLCANRRVHCVNNEWGCPPE
jgi:hypothetical protein